MTTNGNRLPISIPTNLRRLGGMIGKSSGNNTPQDTTSRSQSRRPSIDRRPNIRTDDDSEKPKPNPRRTDQENEEIKKKHWYDDGPTDLERALESHRRHPGHDDQDPLETREKESSGSGGSSQEDDVQVQKGEEQDGHMTRGVRLDHADDHVARMRRNLSPGGSPANRSIRYADEGEKRRC